MSLKIRASRIEEKSGITASLYGFPPNTSYANSLFYSLISDLT
jgi:hypothetical protein